MLYIVNSRENDNPVLEGKIPHSDYSDSSRLPLDLHYVKSGESGESSEFRDIGVYRGVDGRTVEEIQNNAEILIQEAEKNLGDAEYLRDSILKPLEKFLTVDS
jgi:hypothetical protein